MSAITPEQALIQAADVGIHQLPVPTPFAVGRVNAYLIEDDPLTLVDPGPNSDRALSELERLLGEHGRRVEEIGLILVTHNHIDHFGLVEAIVGRSRADVAALSTAAARMANYDREVEIEDEFAVGLMLRHGIPESTVVPLREVSRSFHSFGAPARVTRPLSEGDRIELADRVLTIAHRPGHSPADTLFRDERNEVIFSGDHLLQHISSTPLLSRSLKDTTVRTRALVDYLDSLEATAETPARSLLPGHGEAITDHPALIESRMAAHRRRKEKILATLDDRPLSAYEIAQSLWGNVAVTQAFLCLSEVIGHTDILLEEGRIERIDEEGPIRFAAVAQGES